MSRPITPTHHKLAEKLTILCDRANGMLIRIYNIKKMMGNPDTKPHFFSDKSLDSVIKTVVKKFPTVSSTSFSTLLSPMKEDIIKSLSLYYYTFVDIMDLKDHITDLLTTIDASQVHFDITLNFDLTQNYLDLIFSYFCIMILLSRVEDRKAVLGLFNAAFELQNKKVEDSFPRLGQMIIDYDTPIKKLSEEFIPHSKCLSLALMSLSDAFKKRTQSADDWRASQFMSVLSEPNKLMHSLFSDTAQCEYLSLDLMERWIAVGFLLCYQHLQTPDCYELWKSAMQGSYVLSLCRDEVIHIHSFAIGFLENIKGFSKKVAELKDVFSQTLNNNPLMHRERRKFLRTSLKELGIIFTDQPGLLGPKGLLLLIGLSLARDEVLWMLRHADNLPQKKGNVKAHGDDLNDRQIAELLFHMEELRGLVRKYSQVIQRYYIQYLLGSDASILNQLIQALPAFSEDESSMLSSIYNIIANVSTKQVEANEPFDFFGLRLDWFRLQCVLSGSRSSLHLKSMVQLAKHMNTISFHSKMVDSLDQLLTEASDLSIYCFYTSILEQQFKQCMEFPAQHRFSISFPLICSHFMSTTHPLCPEERHSIGTTSIQYAHWFLKEMSEEVNQVITAICEEQCLLADKLLPKNAVSLVASSAIKKKDKKNKPQVEDEKPGDESRRKHREEFTRMDKLHMALTELCFSINYCNIINVWDHGFVPREFFSQQLEVRFNQCLVNMMVYNGETKDVVKPSELLSNIKAVMSVLQSIENYVHMDISKVFNSVLPQQSQAVDSFNGEPTVCANYTQWYLDVLLRRIGAGHGIYSENHKAFISTVVDPQSNFFIEEYADLMELRALAELVGPYGMKYLNEKLMNHISNQFDEIKKLVIQNKLVLMELRSNFDKPELMKELQKKLTSADVLLQRMTTIGVLLAFRGLSQDALLDILEIRIPFLLNSIKDFQQHAPNGQESMIVNEMASAAGLSCDVDPALCAALRQQKPGEDDYTVACLLMVFIAVAIPRLARTESSIFKPAYEGHNNNIHCLSKAINSLAGALFTVLGHGDVEARLKEFLALASSSLLRLGQEVDKEAIKNRESVYLLLDQIIQESPFLTMDLLESCFPYVLLRTSYHHVYKQVDQI
ncbi:hypothetical protein HELRODRAFT_101134 [Helobdella robusta]|uniref:Membrane-associated protein Hem n=1 Tax=Helobdella robusta TaxID=6412 RepID=T1ED31_HELRO|nr:hypothetical protein HELRODRAFT_101134 [Helobdella robusta]ESO00384.1 hypothetical protein HELRODRAFT_101134 [Helobdella robusta]